MKKPPIQIEDCSKVELHIHVLGYFPQGESILIILWDDYDKCVLRSIMVDCYEKSGRNEMNRFLNKYKLDTNKLDYLIWTHPDLDHSLGIPRIVKNYSNQKTKILIPAGFKNELFKNRSTNLYKSAFSVLQKSIKDKEGVISVATSGLYSKAPTILDKYQDGINDGFNFSIEILAPFSEDSFRWTNVMKYFNKNDISIAFNIRFGPYRFFFGGDTMNYAITKIDEDRMIDTMFIKIPHHGSSTSDSLPNCHKNILTNSKKKFKRVVTAVTTMFENHPTHLPDNIVLDKYKCFSRKILHTNVNGNAKQYGICSLIYKYNSRVPICSFDGDASVYYEDN